jgi:uncharacterized repeat protein (TIGR03847 family)
MGQEPSDFDAPDLFEPEAIGTPGNRRFRIVAKQGSRTASLWVERDQLQELVLSLQQYLVQVTGNDVLRSETDTDPVEPAPQAEPHVQFPLSATIEFDVGPMGLGYDPGVGRIVFLAAPIEVVESEEGQNVLNEEVDPQFRAQLTVETVGQFLKVAESVLASGRPRCPFCGQPLNTPVEPHGCIKMNGYRHIEVE